MRIRGSESSVQIVASVQRPMVSSGAARWRVARLCLVAIICSACSTNPPPSDPVATSQPAASASAMVDIDYAAYVDVALDTMERYFWNTAEVDWSNVRGATLEPLPADPTAGQAHAALRAAVRMVDSSHSAFIVPSNAGRLDVPLRLPSARRIGGVGLLELGPVGGEDVDGLRRYLGAARDSMAEVETTGPACGWIVDVRDNDGGNLGPMLHAVAGLLGEGRVLTAHNRPDADSWLTVTGEGRLRVDGDEASFDIDSALMEPVAWSEDEAAAFEAVYASEPSYVPLLDDPPIAVLTSNRTASAGEVLVIAFMGRNSTTVLGGATLGIPTGVTGFRMVDGAILRLATTTFSDRIGQRHTSNLWPETVIADPSGDGERVVRAAVDWLMSTERCAGGFDLKDFSTVASGATESQRPLRRSDSRRLAPSNMYNDMYVHQDHRRRYRRI